jgi:hypothetical protein
MTVSPIEIALCLLLLHGALGAFDTFYNHEWVEHLPSRPEAATELALHSARSWVFALTFAGLAWLEWRGAWGWVALGLIALEYVITLGDSVIEDRTRRLTAIERVNHMLLGLNTGLYAGFVALQVVTRWRHQPTALVPVHYPWLSELLSACAVLIVAWALRDGIASRRQRRATTVLAVRPAG